MSYSGVMVLRIKPTRAGSLASFLLELAASVPQAIVTGTEAFPGSVLELHAQAGQFVQAGVLAQTMVQAVRT